MGAAAGGAGAAAPIIFFRVFPPARVPRKDPQSPGPGQTPRGLPRVNPSQPESARVNPSQPESTRDLESPGSSRGARSFRRRGSATGRQKGPGGAGGAEMAAGPGAGGRGA